MNYYAPRELIDADGKPTGKWHYTVQNDNRVCAVGYCSPWESCHACKDDPLAVFPEKLGGPPCATCGGTRLLRKANPCPGHDTPDGAYQHQAEYELDTARYYIDTPEARAKASMLDRCEVCQEFTCGFAEWGNGGRSPHPLCNAHNNRETVATLVRVGDCVSSC